MQNMSNIQSNAKNKPSPIKTSQLEVLPSMKYRQQNKDSQDIYFNESSTAQSKQQPLLMIETPMSSIGGNNFLSQSHQLDVTNLSVSQIAEKLEN